MNLCRLLSLACLAAACAAARPAAAQCGDACYGGYGGYGYGAWDIGRLYGVLSQNVPFYAAFPPVYYSAPVPRTYGYSPFAYPPGVRTPEVQVSEPLSINNPYFKGGAKPATVESAPKAAADRTTGASKPTPQPLVINNPFVTNSAVAQR